MGQITALRAVVSVGPVGVEEAVRHFSGARGDLVARHLKTLAILGEVQEVATGRYAAAGLPSAVA